MSYSKQMLLETSSGKSCLPLAQGDRDTIEKQQTVVGFCVVKVKILVRRSCVCLHSHTWHIQKLCSQNCLLCRTMFLWHRGDPHFNPANWLWSRHAPQPGNQNWKGHQGFSKFFYFLNHLLVTVIGKQDGIHIPGTESWKGRKSGKLTAAYVGWWSSYPVRDI